MVIPCIGSPPIGSFELALRRELCLADAVLVAEPASWWPRTKAERVTGCWEALHEHAHERIARLAVVEPCGASTPGELERLPSFDPARDWAGLLAWIDASTSPPRLPFAVHEDFGPRPGEVVRSDVLDAIDEALHESSRVIVRGPAGSGKTRVLAQWLARRVPKRKAVGQRSSPTHRATLELDSLRANLLAQLDGSAWLASLEAAFAGEQPSDPREGQLVVVLDGLEHLHRHSPDQLRALLDIEWPAGVALLATSVAIEPAPWPADTRVIDLVEQRDGEPRFRSHTRVLEQLAEATGFAEQLLERARGSLLYASAVVEQQRLGLADPPLDRLLARAETEAERPALPRRFARWLALAWARIEALPTTSRVLVRDALGLLAIAREPLHAELVDACLRSCSGPVRASELVLAHACELLASPATPTLALLHPAIGEWIRAEIDDARNDLEQALLDALSLAERASGSAAAELARAYLGRHRSHHMGQASLGPGGSPWAADVAMLQSIVRERGPLVLEQRLAGLGLDPLQGEFGRVLVAVLQPWSHVLRVEPDALPGLLWNGLLSAGWTRADLQRRLLWPEQRLPPLRLRFPLAAPPRWHRAFAGHAGEVQGCAITADGKLVLTIGEDASVRLWSSETGEELHRFETDGILRACAMTPDGRWAVVGGFRNRIHRFDLVERKAAGTLDQHRDSVIALAISDEGDTVISGGADGKVLVWHPGRGFAGAIDLGSHAERCTSVAISPGGSLGLSGGADKRGRVWELAEPRQRLELSTHEYAVQAVALDRLAQRAWTLSISDGRRFNTTSGTLEQVYPSRSGIVRGCVLISDERELIVAQSNGRLELWSVDGGKDVGGLLAHAGETTGCDATPDGQLVVSSSVEGLAKLWTREGLTSPSESVWDGACKVAAIDPSGSVAVIAAGHSQLALLDLASNTIIRKFHDAWSVLAAAWIDEQRFVTTSTNQGVRIWDREHDAARTTFTVGRDWLRCVALSPDRRRLVVGGDDKLVFVIDLEDEDASGSIGSQERWIYACAFTPKGDEVVVADNRGGFKVWDIEHRRARLDVSPGNNDQVHAVVVTTTPARVITAGKGGAIEVWDLERGQLIDSQLAHPRATVKSLALSPDQRLLASAGSDGVLRLWATGTKLRPLAALRGPAGFAHVSLRGATLVAGDELGNAWVVDIDAALLPS